MFFAKQRQTIRFLTDPVGLEPTLIMDEGYQMPRDVIAFVAPHQFRSLHVQQVIAYRLKPSTQKWADATDQTRCLARCSYLKSCKAQWFKS